MSRLLTLRKERGMTQEEVAYVLGTNQQQVSKYERKTSFLSETDIVKLTSYFGVTADYFLELSDLRLEVATQLIDQSMLPMIYTAEVAEMLYYFTEMDSSCRKLMIEIGKRFANQKPELEDEEQEQESED